MYQEKEKITVMTAYDYPTGRICEEAGVDMTLVGDSLAMVCLGMKSTNQITLDDMIHHSKAVQRACHSPFLIGDMPFGSYETSPQDCMKNAIRYMKEGNVEMVKIEGGKELKEHIKLLKQWGIPTMTHIGLTPQRHVQLGGFKVQGKTLEMAKQLVQDALELQEAGADMMVLEAIPMPVATFITQLLSIPTIGIGAGPHCSGQVLVQADTLGLYDRKIPQFCKVYRQQGKDAIEGIKEYCQEVKQGTFPHPDYHVYSMNSVEELALFQEWTRSIKT